MVVGRFAEVSFLPLFLRNENSAQIQGQVNNDPDEGSIDGVDDEDVFVNQCSGSAGQWCHVIIYGRIKALCIDNSSSVLICADTVLDHVYIVNSNKIQLIIGGKVPRIIVEGCIGVELLTGVQDDEHVIETEKSSGVVVAMAALPDAPSGRAAPAAHAV